MRWIGWLLLVLVGIGWLATEVPPAPTAASADVPWRRTRDGWQQAAWLSAAVSPRRPALHPGVVAALELLVSVMVLTAFSPGFSRRREKKDAPRHWLRKPRYTNGLRHSARFCRRAE